MYVCNVCNVCMYVCMYVCIVCMYGMYGMVWYGMVWYGMYVYIYIHILSRNWEALYIVRIGWQSCSESSALIHFWGLVLTFYACMYKIQIDTALYHIRLASRFKTALDSAVLRLSQFGRFSGLESSISWEVSDRIVHLQMDWLQEPYQTMSHCMVG